MAIIKTELMIKGEELLFRLQKANRQVRKLYKIKDNDQIKTLARLKAAHDLLSERIGNDALLLAADESPLIGLSIAEKQDRLALKKDIDDLCSLTKKIRDVAANMIKDLSEDITNPHSRIDEKKSHIADAMKALKETGFADALTIEQESTAWQEPVEVQHQH